MNKLIGIFAQVVDDDSVKLCRELIPDGGFVSGIGNWGLYGWDFDVDKVIYKNITDGGSARLHYSNLYERIRENLRYRVQFDVAIIAGSAVFKIADYSTVINLKGICWYGAGHYDFVCDEVPLGYDGGIAFVAYLTSDNEFTLDNISLKEI